MISRFGASEGFVLVFWGKGLLHWFSGLLALVEMHMQGAGRAVLIVSTLVFAWWCCLAPWGCSVLMVARRELQNGFAWLSSPEQRACACYFSCRPHRRETVTSLMSLAFIRSLSSWCLVLSVLSQVYCWASKLQILGTCAAGRVLILWGRISPCCCHLPSVPGKWLQWFGVHGKVEQKTDTNTRCPQPVSLLLCLGIVQHVSTTLSSVS